MNNEEMKPMSEEEKFPEEETALSADVWPDPIDFDLYKSYLKDWKEEIIDSEAINITDEDELMRLPALIDEAAEKVLATVREKGSKGREKAYLLKQLRALQRKSGVTSVVSPEPPPTESMVTRESVVIDEGADILASSGDETDSVLSATSTESVIPEKVVYSPELAAQIESWKGSFLEKKREENLSEEEISKIEKLADQASVALGADMQSTPGYIPSEADFLKKNTKFQKLGRPFRTGSTVASSQVKVSKTQFPKAQEGIDEPKTPQEPLEAIKNYVSTTNDAPPEIIAVASPKQPSDVDPENTEFSKIDQPNQTTSPLPEQKKVSSRGKTTADRLREAQARGEVISEKTLKDIAHDAREINDREWATGELRKIQQREKPENLFVRMQKLPEDEIPDAALKMLLGSKKSDERAWAEALDKKRKGQKASEVVVKPSVDRDASTVEVSVSTLEDESPERAEGSKSLVEQTPLGEVSADEISQQQEVKKDKNPSVTEKILVSIRSGNGGVVSMEMLKKHEQFDPEIAAYYETRREEEKRISSQSAVETSRGYKHKTPDVDERVTPEMLETLKDAGIEKAALTRGAQDVVLDGTPLPIISNSEDVATQKSRKEEIIIPEAVNQGEIKITSEDLRLEPKEGELILDEQGEAMQHLIDNTPEVVNLGKTELAPDAPYPKTEEEKSDSAHKPNFVLVGEPHLDYKPNFVLVDSPQHSKENYPVVPYVPFEVVTTDEEKSDSAHKPNFVLVGEPHQIKDEELAEKTEINFGAAHQFEKRFGIHEADLENIAGFRDLSDGQQLLVLKNLEQLAVGDIKKEARSQAKDEWSKKKWYEKIGKQLITFGAQPELRVAQIEKALAKKEHSGSPQDPERVRIIAERLAALDGLTKVAKEGPDIKVGEKGTLEIQYVSLGEGAHTPEALATAERFNNIASEYAKFPHEWGYETTKPGFFERFSKDRRQYSEVKKHYEESRVVMLAAFKEKMGKEEGSEGDVEKKAMLMMNQVDEQVQLNQLFNGHPDAEKALQQIEGQNEMWIAAREFMKSKGGFVAAGALARYGTLAVTGGLALPVLGVIGFGVGGGIGVTEGKNLMKQRRVEGRMSEEDEREEILYNVPTLTERIKSRQNKLLQTDLSADKRQFINDDLAALRKRLEIEGEIPKEERIQKRKLKEFTDATFFADRINRLSAKLAETKDSKGRELLEKRIAQTTALMREKFERGMINFGGASLEGGDVRKGDTIANKLSFIQALAKGEIDSSIDRGNVEEEIERMTGLRQEKIEDARKQEITKIATKSALMRASFALGGAFIVEGAKDFIHFGEVEFNGNQVKMVGDALRDAPNTSGMPDEVVMSGRSAEIKAFEEYMTDTNPAHRAQLLETIGMSKEQMDAKIAELLAKGHEASGVVALNTTPDSSNPEAFNATNFDKNIPSVVGRTPSPEELSTLRSTGGVDSHATANMDKHNALIAAVSESKTPLTHEQIQAILGKGTTTTGVEGVSALSYTIKDGDNLSHIMKENLAVLKGLTPPQQVNVIQNFIHKVSPLELKAIGITDVEKIQIGEKIQLDKLNEILLSKQVAGENLVAHAQHIAVAASHDVSPRLSSAAEVAPSSGLREVDLSPLSDAEALSVEHSIGRALSASESHVLHGLQGLADLSEPGASRDNVAMAWRDLEDAMKASPRSPLLMVEMESILHAHDGLDAQIKFPEVPAVAPHAPLADMTEGRGVAPAATAASPVEATPRVLHSEGLSSEQVANWRNLTEGQKLPLAIGEAERYVDLDMKARFGTDAFGNVRPEWLALRSHPATEFLGMTKQDVMASSNGKSIAHIQEYVIQQGFTQENGYIPNNKETIEEFLRRSNTMKILEDGPRKVK